MRMSYKVQVCGQSEKKRRRISSPGCGFGVPLLTFVKTLSGQDLVSLRRGGSDLHFINASGTSRRHARLSCISSIYRWESGPSKG